MKKLIVPVYLNQKIVFDLLAMLQDGISMVTAITKNSSNTSSSNENLSVGFGLNEALSTLFKVDLSVKKDKNKLDNETSSIENERVHTPSSLFFNLRNLLIEHKHLKELTIDYTPNAGDFIEFEGNLRRNPIVETLDSLNEMMKIAEAFDETTNQNKKNKQNSPISEYKKFQHQITQFLDSLKIGDTIDLTVDELTSEYKALITVETKFLNDPLMSDLVDGRFKVLGKVIKSVNEEETINLLRKTAFSKMPPLILTEMFSGLSQLGSIEGFNIPNLEWEIKGKAFQVIPIAIYA